tara:strand:- start:188 stop:1261 length:1074 start_codon:yes stop_codon:yes gene_type:complete
MELNKIIFSFSLPLLVFFISTYLLYFLNKKNFNFLKDDHFNKPQAFHENPTYRAGGLIIFLSLCIVFFYLFISDKYFVFEYLSFCSLFFILGFIDDLKVNIKPKFRLFIMIIFLLTLIIFHEFKIERISLDYLDHLMKIDIFALFFICLCFLFIINGSNLIDGFNGLLSIHSLIILSSLSFINFIYGNYSLAYLLFNVCIIVLIFIKFNFPKAQMFLGDSGAYLMGTLIAVSAIITNNLIPSISSFFFCILLFYLFFEVFFSFFRKIFVERKNPLLPDRKHLHMLLYNFLLKKNNKKLNSNYKVSIYINLIYLSLIIPGFIFMHNGLFCRYYFFLLLIIYIYTYKKFYVYEKIGRRL